MSDPNLHSFQPPPPPSFGQPSVPAGPTLSTTETLTGIFFEPGRVFEALRDRPRFLAATLIVIASALIFTFFLFQRVGYENIARAAIESNSRLAEMSPDQKEQLIQRQTSPVFKALAYVYPVIGTFIFFAIGAAVYLLGAMMMARSMSYWQALSVWAYSSMPPFVLIMLLNIVLLFLTSPDNIDMAHASRGLVRANLGWLVSPSASPMLATALGAIDVFAFYGLFLAALGLRKVARLSSGAAWGIVIVVWVIGVVARIAFAGIFGTAMA